MLQVLCYRTGVCLEVPIMLQRREFMKVFSAMGLGGTLMPGVLWAQSQGKPAITKELIDDAAKIAGVVIPDADKEMMLENLNDRARGFDEIFHLHIPNSVAPSLLFFPETSGVRFETRKSPMLMSEVSAPAVSKSPEDLAFATVRELAELVRNRKISSTALTTMYLERLKRYDPKLKFVVTLTEERALGQAREADREIASGKYRGPLHGLPWGAKDLLAVKGYPTTWGAGGFEKQIIDEDATVVKRLDEAGAVLIAKLTLGALANGDHWFGGITRNPWNSRQGSSGSSPRPPSAPAASRSRFGACRRLCCVQYWLRDARIDFFTVHALRLYRFAANFWICAAHWRHGAFLEHGQTRANLPERGRLRAGSRRDPRP